MVDRKFVEAADALRFEMVNAHDGSFAPFVDRSLKDKIEAYDTARSRLAAAQPAEHPESIGGLASRTPASKQGKKALDEMLLVFAKHDDDEEDCWTQPARRGVQYVSDLEWDLETQVRLASHRAEANESLRIMLSNLAAYTGTHFGPDEPLKNYERVRKTLTDKPEPPAAPAESAPLTHAAQLIDAAMRIDWKQVGLNGGGCFHLEEDGRFCLRAHYWAGHGGEKPTHMYEPLYVVMTRIAKASDAAPALAALVEAADAMQNAGHLLRTSCYQVQVTPEARMWDDALAAYDRARAALPKDGAS